jgi:ubiquinone/menaquinone biosynthesis C-methylase UbiE
MEIAKRLAKFGIETFYNYVSYLDKDSEVTLLNYGYDGGDSSLGLEGCSDRYRLQLYHHVVSSSSIDIAGKDVLEVGAGRGGGAAYLARVFGPRSYHAVDLSRASVDFCQRRHRLPNLIFSRQDAESLEIEDCSVDAVINIESSHNYPSLDRFLRQVYRVLRTGGHFLYADLRSTHRTSALHSILDEIGFKVIRNENIAANVVSALDKDNDEKLKLLQRSVPRALLGPMKVFAGVRDTPVYAKLKSGEMAYFNLSLRK